MATLIWSFPDPNWKFCYVDFRVFAMPVSLVSLFLSTYFNIHDSIKVGTEIYGDSRMSLKKLSSVECITVCSEPDDSYLCAWNDSDIFHIYRLQAFGGELGGAGRGGRAWGFPKQFSSIILGKDGCYWNTVVLQIGLFSLCAFTECSTWTRATKIFFAIRSALPLLIHVLIKLCSIFRPFSNVWQCAQCSWNP